MRTLVGMAALVWMLKQLGPVGWFLLLLVAFSLYLVASAAVEVVL